jgi:glycosyltransferase involved in cell wall biosynthesis
VKGRSPRVVQVTTTDISLLLLLGPQLTAIRDAGYEVVGLSAPGPYVGRLEELGIHHLPLRHATRAMAPGRDVAACAELVRAFRDLEPDIVHTHNPKPGVYGRLAARAARVPNVVNTVHGLYAQPGDPIARRAVVYGLERIAARCSDAELVQNPEDIPVLRKLGVPSNKLHVLGNGIDLDRFDRDRVGSGARAALRREWNIPEEAVVCGAVGRLVAEKGYRELFNAAAILRNAAPHLHFVIVGPADTDKADAIAERDVAAARELGNVHFVGERTDIERCYTAFDVYALASYREGFPRSAMEAAAMGLPIVATNIRGCRQVVDDGITGHLVPTRDAFALAGAIQNLTEAPHLLAKMGAAGCEKARKEFDQQRCIDITLGVYEELLGRRASSRIAA